jgi:hypothetical protein
VAAYLDRWAAMPNSEINGIRMYLSEDVICNFLRLAIDQLKLITPAEQHRWATTRILRRENGYEIHFSTRPDFSLITALGHSRHQIPSINSFVENLEKDTRFQHLQHATSVRWWDLEPDQIALSLLRSYVNQINELKYDEELATQVAKNFLLSLDKGHSDVTLYCVVRGLNCDFDKYMLPDGIQLRKLTDDEIVKLIDHNPAVAHEDLMPSNCCLLEKRLALPVRQLPLEVNPVSKQPLEIATEEFDAVITALRLLNDGRVERQNVYMDYDYPGQLIVPNMTGRSSARTYRFAGFQTYELSQEQLPTLARIITAIKSGSIPAKMRTAVDRVNFAAERDRADDRLLDLLFCSDRIETVTTII